jgi:hypothetical protein
VGEFFLNKIRSLSSTEPENRQKLNLSTPSKEKNQMGISFLSFKVQNDTSFQHECHVHLRIFHHTPWYDDDYGVCGTYDIPEVAKNWSSHLPYKPIDQMINKIFLEGKQLHLNNRNYLEYDTKMNVDALLKALKEKIVNNQLRANIYSSTAELDLFVSSISNTSLFSEQQKIERN